MRLYVLFIFLEITMRKNIYSTLSAILCLIALIYGAINLFPYFQKGAVDVAWIYMIVTIFPLMGLIYSLAGADENCKHTAPNSYALGLCLPSIIAGIYLGMWLTVFCMLFTSIFSILQMMQNSDEEESNPHHH